MSPRPSVVPPSPGGRDPRCPRFTALSPPPTRSAARHGAARSPAGRRGGRSRTAPPHPHHGRALGHRQLEVAGHTHRALVQPQPVRHLAYGPEGLRRRLGVGRGHRHQPGHPQASSPRAPTTPAPRPAGTRCDRATRSCPSRPAPWAPPPAGRSRRLAQPRHPLPAVDERGEHPHLFRCTAPRKCHRARSAPGPGQRA